MEAPATIPRATLPALYEEALSPALRELDRKARRFGALLNAATILAAPPALLAAWRLHVRHPGEERWILPLGVVLFGHLFARMGFDGWWKRRFKRRVLAPFVAASQDGVRYEPDGFVAPEVFQSSRLFPLRAHDYRGEDRMSGADGAVRFEVSEISARHCIKRWSPLKRIDREAWVPLFRGIFFVADFSKGIEGTTLVLPRAAGALRQEVVKAIRQEGRGKRETVELEDPEFRRVFEVLSDDQVQARYLLSPSLMSRLVEFQRDRREPFALSLTAAKLFLALFSSQDLFKPIPPREVREALASADGAQAMLRRLGDYSQDLRFGRHLVEELNLNVRIWSRPDKEDSR
jgi:uncharacterized protein DUF3137